MLRDRFGRVIDSLRISVTDRCNFRCRYCWPAGETPLVPRAEILRFEEITRVARCFLTLGGRRLRITGGEPLLRRDLPLLIRDLAQLPGLEDIALTTNGSLLAPQAAALRAAGLARITISLDTLDPHRFAWIAMRDAFDAVWEGINAAIAAGFAIKCNAVVINGITKAEVWEMIAFTTARGIELRFIEFMPLCGTNWSSDTLYFPIDTVRGWVEERWALTPIPRGSAPAETFQLGGGRVGFIASLSHPFCDRCARLRLTTNGRIRPCLFSHLEYDLQPALAEPTDTAVYAAIREAVAGKPAGHAAHTVAEWQGEAQPLIGLVGG